MIVKSLEFINQNIYAEENNISLEIEKNEKIENEYLLVGKVGNDTESRFIFMMTIEIESDEIDYKTIAEQICTEGLINLIVNYDEIIKKTRLKIN